MNFKDKTGEISINNDGLKMTIINYNQYSDIDVKFEDGYISKNKGYREFKNGSIKNPYYKNIFSIACIGEGKYKSTINKIKTNEYKTWSNLLKRCYETKEYKNFSTYKECVMCEEWHNFQNFAQWYDENYYTVDDETMDLDKDILIKRNKIYSPNTCVFVPHKINSLFIKSDKVRGEYPIGVCYNKRDNNFQANLSKINMKKFLGYYDTPEKAFEVYKR